MRCPECSEVVDGERLVCAHGHRIIVEDGVLRLTSAAFAARLRAFTGNVQALREACGRRLIDPAAYPGLPHSQQEHGDREWRREWRDRAADLALVTRLLDGRPRRVLDVGAWNGWLCNQLALQGHDVTGVDYFDDRHDGLGARAFYPTAWTAIQMNLTDLSLLDTAYDAVVLNRCLQFFPDPAGYARHAAGMLAPGGVLIATGLQFYRDANRKQRDVARLQRAVRAQFGFDLFLEPTRGYLDFEDLERLKALGMHVTPYRRLRRANLISAIVRTRPWHAYALLDPTAR